MELFKIEHSKRNHSAISPSGAYKWLNCTANPYMEQQFATDESYEGNDYSKEGTLAHEFAETLIRLKLSVLWAETKMGFYYNHDGLQDSTLEDRIDELMMNKYYYNGMENDVLPYVNECVDLVGLGSWCELEPQIDLSCISKHMKGHIDFVLHEQSTSTLHVIDLKFGLGVQVSAENNPQLLLYAIGYIRTKRLKIKHIYLTIVQPRKHHKSTWYVDIEYLEAYEKYAKDVVANIVKGDVNLNLGEHCRWCKVKDSCPEMRTKLEDIEFKANIPIHAVEYTDEDIAYILRIESIIKQFYKELKENMQRKLENGHDSDLFKLVEGRSTTKIDTEQLPSLLKDFRANQIPNEKVFKREMRTLTDLKKTLGTKLFKQIVLPYTYKTKGNTTLAFADDKRNAVGNSAELDFDELFD